MQQELCVSPSPRQDFTVLTSWAAAVRPGDRGGAEERVWSVWGDCRHQALPQGRLWVCDFQGALLGCGGHRGHEWQGAQGQGQSNVLPHHMQTFRADAFSSFSLPAMASYGIYFWLFVFQAQAMK